MEVECPICGSSFPSSKIEVHAEACIQASFSSNSDAPQQIGLSEKSSDPEFSSAGNKRKFEAMESHQSSKSSPTNFFGSKGPASSSKKIRGDQAAAWSFLGKSGSGSKSNRDQSAPNAPQQSQESDGNTGVPLAERMRPATLDDYIGQESILSSNSFLKNLISKDSFINMILWGPPGCGKTSLANIIAKRCRGSEKWRYASLSACTSGVQDVKKVVQEAQSTLQLRKRRTVLFMDEVHRFNKAQQDIFLPHVESGLLTLVGATTENPSFTLNSALLSRCRVITLEALSVKNIRKILQRALKKLKIGIELNESENEEESSTDEESEEEEEEPDEQEEENADTQEGKENSLKISRQALRWLSNMSGGDARCALNTLQTLVTSHSQGTIKTAEAKEALQRSHVLYDRKGEEHYNMASALQKSIRGGNDNAALYWTMRMVKGGEDPRFIARRLVRTAAEDIGLGDPQALNLAVSTMQAVQMLGMPESNVILCQCAVYLARANHNPEVYMAMNRILQHMETHTGPLPSVPLHLRNAPTKLMKDIGYGKGYTADPRFTRNIEYMPDALRNVNFFQSTG
ncbi:ATPase WRNIP1-like [Penaeus chinensis]|uniref:ATPase WRNIP1-like n=1 Tax=Penaeus chinensis TaxID=139456 RepID=UPI001FB7620C|nr:ATPase WRNIP1-like [Penaeus chinensis]